MISSYLFCGYGQLDSKFYMKDKGTKVIKSFEKELN